MGRPLTTALHFARHKLESSAAWLLLIEIPLRVAAGSPAQVIRAARNPRHVFAGGKWFQRAGFTIDLPEESADGSLGQMTIVIPGVSRIAMGMLDSGDFSTSGGEGPGPLLGQLATCWLVNSGSLTDLPAGLSWRHRVLEASVDSGGAKLTCGDPSQIVKVPQGVWDRRIAPQLLPSAGAEVGV